jgi:hypothetical protein
MATDMAVLAPALFFAAHVFDEVDELAEDPRLRSDLFAASPAFVALAAYGRGRWSLDAAVRFCEAQWEQLDRAAAEFGAIDPGFAHRVRGFASAALVVERDLRVGGGYSLENSQNFMARADFRR